MKIARSHILHMIEYALDVSGPVSYTFARYTIDATPYREPGKRGNSGVRVTWRENDKPAKAKKQKTKKSAAKKKKKGNK
jgi:hypothetical protein